MIQITLTIEGMRCGMCEAHVCDAIRRAVPSAKKVAAFRRRNEASFLTGEAVDPEGLRAAVNETGYACLAVRSVPFEKKRGAGKR